MRLECQLREEQLTEAQASLVKNTNEIAQLHAAQAVRDADLLCLQVSNQSKDAEIARLTGVYQAVEATLAQAKTERGVRYYPRDIPTCVCAVSLSECVCAESKFRQQYSWRTLIATEHLLNMKKARVNAGEGCPHVCVRMCCSELLTCTQVPMSLCYVYRDMTLTLLLTLTDMYA